MNISYEREPDGSYLVLREENRAPGYTEPMLTHTRPAHLLELRVRPDGEDWEYRYDISGLKSLDAQLLTRPLSGEEIRSLLQALYRVIRELPEYLLSPDRLCLEPELIFSGKEGWSFLLHPAALSDVYQQIQNLSRYLLRKADHDNPDTASLAYGLFDICHSDNWSFTQVFELLDGPGEEAKSALPSGKGEKERRGPEKAEKTEKAGLPGRLKSFLRL